MSRRDLALTLALGAILALPAVGYFAWLGRRLPERDRAVVVEAPGQLEVRRRGAPWRRADRGDRLLPGDEVRVRGGGALIDAAGRFSLRLEPAAVAGLSSATEVALQDGAVTLDVPAGSAVTVLGRADAAAEVSGAAARFRVAYELEALRVEALEGQVRLRGGGSTLELGAGRVAIIPRGGAPAAAP